MSGRCPTRECGQARGGTNGSTAGYPVRTAIPDPAPHPPPPPQEYAWYALCVPHDPLEQLQRAPPAMARLGVVTANCGGLGSDPRNVPCLIAYLACAGPDIAHLQEAGTQFAAACASRPSSREGVWSPSCTAAS